MELEQISQLLKDAEAQPSAQCWERLSEQLCTLPSAAAAGSIAGKVVLKHGLSMWAKGGIGFAAAAIVATAAILFIPSAEEPASVQQTPVPAATEMPDSPRTVLADTVIMASPVQPTRLHKTVKKDPIQHSEMQNGNGVQPPLLTIEEESAQQTAVQNELPASSVMATQTVASQVIVSEVVEKSAVQDSPTMTVQPSVQEENEMSVAEVNLEIPNVITPNGDGVNDIFVIQHLEECSQHYLIIKNQAGKQVLATQHYGNDWGRDADEGTYFYQLSYKMGEVTKYRNGIITVIR